MGGAALKGVTALSLPIRGAWIEIQFGRSMPVVLVGSLPIRGAWIEMN